MSLFGSALGEDFDPVQSDVDFVVEFQPCTPNKHYERYFGLLEAIEALLARRVDLVEAQALSNPYFISAVEDTQVPIYAA